VTNAFKITDSIGARILAILCIMGASNLLLLALFDFTFSNARQHMERVSGVLYPASVQLKQAEIGFDQLQRREKEAVLLEEPAELADSAKDAAAVADELHSLNVTLEGSPELAARADDLAAQFSNIRSHADQTYGAVLASKDKDNVADDVQARVAKLAIDNARLTAAIESFDALLPSKRADEFHAIGIWSSRTRTAGWTMFALGLIGFTGTWWMLRFRIIQPLNCLSRRMRDIAAGDGDLTARVQINGHSELDEVGHWFNVFIERIEQIVMQVTRSTHALGEATFDLARIAHDSAAQSTIQHDQAVGITASMGEISVAVRQISETTSNAARDARKAEENAHAGGKTVRSTVTTIQELLFANQATANKIAELGKASDAIGAIASTIDNIADQTNLLALNASIEAARAGDHGRGFAVVASEVRRLAERTSLATREIDRSIHAIQAGTAEVVEAMRTSMSHVESGVGSARSAGDALANIIQGSEALQRMVTQIASASAQQSSATESVNANVNEIFKLIERRTSSSARAVDACDRLSLLATGLNDLVGSFKVHDQPPGALSTLRICRDAPPL
jgi:methyl-accepting chemotaxis protein